MKKGLVYGVVAVLGLTLACTAKAQVAPYQEYHKLIKSAEMVQPLKSDLFGDNISLYNGSTEFTVFDVDLPGNNGLPVRLGRTFRVEVRNDAESLGGFGAWDMEVPYMHGVFPFGDKWNVGGNATTNRCSQPFYPNVLAPFHLHEIWSGTKVHIPGGGDQTVLWNGDSGNAQPVDGAAYYWNTRDHMRFKCTTMLNYPGQGFIAVDANGTQYTFNYAIERAGGEVKKNASGWGQVSAVRTKIYLMATRVEDRHGNYVNYQYSGDQLVSISASDGRHITIDYSNGRIVKVTAHGREWHYAYSPTLYFVHSDRGRALASVTLPDQSHWQYQYGGPLMLVPAIQDGTVGGPTCIEPLPDHASFSLVATHPSGATGSFDFDYIRHGVSGIHASACVLESVIGEVQHWVLATPDYHYTFSLVGKTLSGPGISPQQWAYFYGNPLTGRANYSGPYCTNCDDEKSALVTNPDGSKTEYVFGVLFNYNDGRLLGRYDRKADGTVVRSEVNEYVGEGEVAGMPFPATLGYLSGSLDSASLYNRPIKKVTISLDGTIAGPVEWGQQPGVSNTTSFVRQVNSFDAFARPLNVTKSSTVAGSPSRTEVTAYHDNLTKWVLGQVSQSTVNGVVASETSYNANAQPTVYKSFGKTVQTLTWNADGTVATVKDGNNHTTTLGSWKRGTPQSILYADGTSHAAVVNDHGWITRITDQNGFPTDYTYDPMGRLASIVWPTGDSTAWNTTTQVFELVGSAEYGIPSGHWRQTVATGNARKVNYFDALWRPLVSREYDTGNEAGTTRFQRFAYDHDGRTVFASYPGTVHNLTTGTWTEYDALGRATSVSQDSELGLLSTVTQYQSGFKTRVTSPKGQHTTTSYLAWDQPTTDYPAGIAHPEGAYTDIARDGFGKPTALTRRNSDSSISLTRRYVYDAHQQLCKSIEPETGATVMAYDGAGNLSWSASGQNYPSPSACNTGDVAANQKATRTYDARNRLKTLNFPDGRGNQTWTHTPDGLPSQVVTDNASGGEQVLNTYSYNKRRLPTGETMGVGSHLWSLGYGYTANGHLASHVYPGGLSVDYAPNALGQPTRAGTVAAAVDYFPNGAIKQFTYDNGIVHTLVQNARGLPDRSRDAYGGTAFHDDSMDYDAHGNVAAISDGLPGARGNRDMQYDALDRLVSTNSPMFGAASYSYDVLDNLKTVKLTAGTKSRDHAYVYDANWRLTNVTNTPGGPTVIGLGYDTRGNLSNKNGQPYVFDHGNRLREATGLEQYRYDGHGRRVQATRNGAGIYSFYDVGGILRYQRDEHTGHQTGYVYLGGSLVARLKDAIALSTPTLSAPASSISGSYTVSWSSVPLATRYELQERFNSGGWSTIHDAAGTSKAVSGKAAGSWSYQVRACSPATCGGWSPVATVAVELPPTAAPTLTAPSEGLNGNYTVSWTSVASANSYTLEESINAGSWTVAYTGSALSKAFNDRPVGSYAYRVKACNSAGCGPTSATGTVQAIHPPGSVPTLTVPSTSYTGSYTASWSGVTGATRYELEERFNSGGWTQIHDAAPTSKALSGKTAGTWDYRVRGCNTAGCSSYSSVGTTQVTLIPASAPTLTVPSPNYTGSYTVSWTGVATATRYELEERLNSGSWSNIHDAAGTSKALSGKVAGAWDYRVRACNAAGCGGYSSIGTSQVTLPPTAAPSLTAPSPNYTGSYTVSWTGVATATRYELEERFNGGSWSNIHDAAPTSKALSGKVAGTWDYRVRACNAAGCAAYSSIATTQVTLIPSSAPTLTVPATNLTGSYTVSWTGVATATRYELQERLDGGGWTTIHDLPDTSKALSGKAAGAWGYRVRACNAAGCGGYSAIGTTQVTRPPTAAPTLSAPASNSSGSYTVSWSPVSTATSYRLQERLDGGGWTTIHEAGDISKAVSDKASGSWGYQVQGCNAAGCGPFSAVATVAVVRVPAVPQIISAHNHTIFWGAIVLPNCSVQWSSAATATSYEMKSNGGVQSLYTGPNTSVSGAQYCGPTYIVRACNASGCSAWSSPPFVPTVTEEHWPPGGDPMSQPAQPLGGDEGEGQ